jgi:hypothetical protein
MRTLRSRRGVWVLGIIAALLVIPASLACVIPRDLSRQIQLSGDEIAIGTVKAVDEVWLDEPSGSAFPWTVVTFDVQESFVTGRTGAIQIATRGGLQPGSMSTTITPSPEDLKPGRKLLLFLNKRSFENARLDGAVAYVIPSFAEVYRIEDVDTRTGSTQVLLGQGPGLAFPANLELDQARSQLKLAQKAAGGEKR